MKKIPMNHWLVDVALLLNRLSLGMFFLIAGVMKISGGVSQFVNGPYKSTTPSWLPGWFATPYGYALPWAEAGLGALLVIGLFGRIAAGAIAMMLFSFLIAAGFLQEHGPFSTNVILLTLALLLAVSGPGRYALGSVFCGKCKS